MLGVRHDDHSAFGVVSDLRSLRRVRFDSPGFSFICMMGVIAVRPSWGCRFSFHGIGVEGGMVVVF